MRPSRQAVGLADGALEERVACEQRLAAVRGALVAATSALRTLEEDRLRIEHGLEPQREAIG